MKLKHIEGFHENEAKGVEETKSFDKCAKFGPQMCEIRALVQKNLWQKRKND